MAINWKTAVVITACLLAACGGGADRTKAQLRMVNASSGYTQLDLRVDDQLRQGAVAYGAAEAMSRSIRARPPAPSAASARQRHC